MPDAVDRVALAEPGNNRFAGQRAKYYFCGPKPFMQCVYANLKALGVDDDRIAFEFFGPRQEIASDG